MATLGLKEMGKFLWKGREKGRGMLMYWLNILRSLSHFKIRKSKIISKYLVDVNHALDSRIIYFC
jgi:hypothetical protein